MFQSGLGHLMRDVDGAEYVDFISGAGALNYGHNDPDMREALIDHLGKNGLSMGLDLFFQDKSIFIELFNRHILQPRGLTYKMQFVGPTGTNAVEAAIKLARKVTGRTNIVSFTNGYHGCSLGALATTANRGYRQSFAATLAHVHRAFYDGYVPGLDSAGLLDCLLSDPSGGVDDVAAVILEPIQGEGGLNVASRDWAMGIAAVARKHGALLIVDEIQTGCGRSGPFFAFEALNIKPDLVTLAKSLSGFGLPMALTLIRPDIDIWAPAEHTGTFRGNAHACVTANVAIQKFWTNTVLSDRVATLEKRIRDSLGIAEDRGWQIKGSGMMVGIRLPDAETAQRIQARCLERRLLIERCGPSGEVLKLLPCLTITDDGLDQGLAVLVEALRNERAIDCGDKLPGIAPARVLVAGE